MLHYSARPALLADLLSAGDQWRLAPAWSERHDDMVEVQACASAATSCSRACPRPPGVVSTRERGLMVAAEVNAEAPEIARRALLEQHLIVNATGATTLRLLPPLIVSGAEIEGALSRLRALSGIVSMRTN